MAIVLIALCNSSHMLMMITSATNVTRFLPIPHLLVLQAKQDSCCFPKPVCIVADIILSCGQTQHTTQLKARAGSRE